MPHLPLRALTMSAAACAITSGASADLITVNGAIGSRVRVADNRDETRVASAFFGTSSVTATAPIASGQDGSATGALTVSAAGLELSGVVEASTDGNFKPVSASVDSTLQFMLDAPGVYRLAGNYQIDNGGADVLFSIEQTVGLFELQQPPAMNTSFVRDFALEAGVSYNLFTIVGAVAGGSPPVTGPVGSPNPLTDSASFSLTLTLVPEPAGAALLLLMAPALLRRRCA